MRLRVRELGGGLVQEDKSDQQPVRISGRVSRITGTRRGFGLAVSKGLAAAGAKLAKRTTAHPSAFPC